MSNNFPDVLSEMDGGATKPGGGGQTHRLKVTVCDPVKQDQGMNAYITYKVNTSTDRPDFQYSQFSVIRRYKDFVWLHERLGEEFPGIIMPPLPEKMVMGRFDTEFIEKRRKELERFLNRLATHEELSGSGYFRTFLQADDAGLADTKESEKVTRRQKSGAGLLKWFDERATIIKTHVRRRRRAGLREAPKSPADLRFEEVSAYVANLDVQMQNVAKHASALVRKEEQLAATLFDFGIAFTMLANAEEKKAPLGQALMQMGHAADGVSSTVRNQSLKEADLFESPMLEYVKIVGALKVALQKRNEKKTSYLAAAHDLEAKRAAHSKLVGVAGKEAVLQQHEAASQAAVDALEEAKADYEKVSERVIREFRRFKMEKAADMKKIILDYVNIQVAFTQKAPETWQALIPQIEAMELE
ncbi:unnamed protein product, partial [Phaeothamnion confervicola]